MKLRVKSVIRRLSKDFDLLENNQLLYTVGNLVCIRDLDTLQYEFIQMDKKMDHLYCFKSGVNKKTVLTVQKVAQSIEVCCYNLKGQKKGVRLSDTSNFFPHSQIIHFQLLPDHLETAIFYGSAKTKNDSVVFLVDLTRSKIITLGFLGYFQNIKTAEKQNYDLSICGKGFLRLLKSNGSSWQVDDRLPKKLSNQNIILHQWIKSRALAFCTKTQIFLMNNDDIIQTINMDSNLRIFQRIPHGFFVVSQEKTINLFSLDVDTLLLTHQGKKQINITNNGSIIQAVLSQQKDNLVISFNNYELFSWRTDQLNESQIQQKFNFIKHFDAEERYDEGLMAISSSKNYALINEANRIILWDLQNNKPSICMQVGEKQSENIISGIAVSPDGYSMTVGFSDKIKMYKILVQSFKCYGQFALKKCKIIRYSRGGQLVACISGKGFNSCITIINTLFGHQVMVIRAYFDPFQMIWGLYDDQFVVATKKNTLLCFNISQQEKIWQLQFQQNFNFIQYDSKSNKIVISTNKLIYLVDNNKTIDKISVNIPNFDYVLPSDGGYYIATKNGILYTSLTLDFTYLQQIRLFINSPFHLLSKKDRLICYSSFSQILMIDTTKLNFGDIKSSLKSEIVMVEKEEINKIFEKIKILQANLQGLQTVAGIKIQEQRTKYENSLTAHKHKFLQQISSINQKYQNLLSQKVKQQKQSHKVFDDVELSQLKNITDIQKMYDKKLKIQKQKYLNLEQENLQAGLQSKKLFKQLQLKHQKDIQKIRLQYQNNFEKEFNKVEIKKNAELQYKKAMETKIINLQEENQLTLFNLQSQKDNQIKALLQKLFNFEIQLNNRKDEVRNLEEKNYQITTKYKQNKQNMDQIQYKLLEYENRIKLLQMEIQKKNNIIEQKNTFIEQQAAQICGLQKAKNVLGFRTVQVRRQLQPKQFLIEKLKSQLFKIDEQYNEERDKTFKLEQKLQQSQKLVQFTKRQLNQIKMQLKSRVRKLSEISSEIYKIINHVDKNQWPSCMVELYRRYVNNQKYHTIQQDDNLAEQITRNLMHVEKSLIQANNRNQKVVKDSAIDKTRKMKENADLIFDLNNMRKKENQYLNQIQQKDNQINRMKRQMADFHKSNRISTTANTGVTRRLQSKDRTIQHHQLELKIRGNSEHQSKRNRRIFSANNTLLWRQYPGKKQKNKIVTDLAKQLQIANNTIRRQDKMIQQLNQRLLGEDQNLY